MHAQAVQYILFLSFLWLAWPLASGALEESRLEVVDIQPCFVSRETVSRSNSITYSLKANFSLCENFSDSSYALRVSTLSSEANGSFPLVFVTRQGKAVDSWTIPFRPPDFSIDFDRVNRTLCQQDTSADVDDVLAYIDVFTSFSENVTFSIVFEPVGNYTFRNDTWYSIVVGASTPQVHFFEFPDGVDTVTVEAEASNKRCAILSVENVTCPINDLLEEIKSKGRYQTMSIDGFLTVINKSVSQNSFLLILITTNYSECHSSDYTPLSPLNYNGSVLGFDQTIRVYIRPLEAVPVVPIVFPLIVFGVFYVVAFICIYLEALLKCRWTPCCKWECMKKKENTTTGTSDDENTKLHVRLNSTHTSYGSTSTASDSGPTRTQSQGSLDLSIMNKDERDLKLPQMYKSGYKYLQSQYSVYSWNTVTVGIFYALPAFQLVLSQQLLANNSGQEDLCYYNFKCTHPVGLFNSFNNVWSNIGYVLLGILFIIITRFRKWRYTRACTTQRKANRGIPQFYGIYYAMGLALIMEGLMSSFYHICPSNANFQFDTAFMFIIAGLLLTKIFQNRHPDVHANAFIAFFSFAVVIVFTLLGIYYDRRNPVAVRLSLFSVVLVMLAGFFCSFYYFHRWKFSMEMFRNVFKSFKFYFTTKPCNWTLLHRVRFLKLFIALWINVLITIVAIAGYTYLDFATTILTFFLVNVLWFLSAYIMTKLYYREPWTLLPLVLPVIISVLWAGALYFFLRNVSSWQRTPAESRDLNRPCVFMDFYDSHDIWHFLSSCALFFSFLFFMTLDDGIADWEHTNIQVF